VLRLDSRCVKLRMRREFCPLFRPASSRRRIPASARSTGGGTRGRSSIADRGGAALPTLGCSGQVCCQPTSLRSAERARRGNPRLCPATSAAQFHKACRHSCTLVMNRTPASKQASKRRASVSRRIARLGYWSYCRENSGAGPGSCKPSGVVVRSVRNLRSNCVPRQRAYVLGTARCRRGGYPRPGR
jgi:hypothetical protein